MKIRKQGITRLEREFIRKADSYLPQDFHSRFTRMRHDVIKQISNYDNKTLQKLIGL